MDVITVDIETTGTSPWKGDQITGVAVKALGEEPKFLTPSDFDDFCDDYIYFRHARVVMHNSLFDISFLDHHDNLLDYDDAEIYDTMACAWLMDENEPLALKKIAAKLFGDDADEEQRKLKELMKAHCQNCGSFESKTRQKRKVCKACDSESWILKRGIQDLTFDELKDYACQDVILTEKLYLHQQKRMTEELAQALRREHEVLRIVHGMTMKGVAVDLSRVTEGQTHCLEEIECIEAVYRDVNLRSPQQVSELLVSKGVKLKAKTNSGHFRTDVDSLLPHQKHSVVQDLLSHRKYAKELGFYESLRENLGKDRRLHPRFRPQGTVSGRFSCSDPNAQQWPREGGVRECIPSIRFDHDVILLTADLSQAELRVAASYAGCARLIKLFEEDADVYQAVADELGVTRHVGKIVTLSSLYGVGPRKLRTILLRGGIDVPEKEAKEYLNEYFRLFPELKRLQRIAEQRAREKGYVNLIVPGRKRRFPPSHWKANPKDAINALVQGGVAEVMKEWMLQTDAHARQWHVSLVLQVHDSLTWEVPGWQEEEWKQYATQKWEQINPFKVSIPVEWKRGV